MVGRRRDLWMGALQRQRPHLAAALLFALLVFLLLWRALVGGEILSPIANLYTVVPWSGIAPSDLDSYLNPELVDLPLVDFPWRFLAREFIHEGTFPAWNPYVLGGIPFYSNPQTGIFSPFNLPLWVLPLTYGLGVSAALKLLAAALGMYALARQLRLGFLPGLLAGVAFSFAAVNIVWLSHETLPGVVVLLPWAIWLVERIFARRRPGSAIALALVIAAALGGGHPGMQVHLLFVTALYVVLRAAFGESKGGERLRALALIGGGLAAGVLLMAFMLVPELLSSRDTVGVIARRAGVLPGDRMPLEMARTVAFPDWWGRPSAIERGSGYTIAVNYNERTFYPGAVALLLACVGLLARGGWRSKAPFALLGALGIAIPLDAPGLEWLVAHAPVLDAVQAQRMHFAFAFAVAVLAAFGLQALLDSPLRRRYAAIPLAAAIVGALAWTGSGARPGDVGRTVRHFLTGADYELEGVLALTSVVWFLLFALGVAAALLLLRARPRWRVAIAAALVLLAAGDAYHFARGYNPIAPAAKVIPPVTPAIAHLIRHRDDGRMVGVNSSLPNDWGLVYGIRDVRGYDPPQPTRRMFALWQLANPRQLEWRSFTLDDWTQLATKVLSVLSARWVIAPPGLQLEPSQASGLRVVYEGGDGTVIENTNAAPRVLVPSRVLVTAGGTATLRAVTEPRFDARTAVAIERGQPGVAQLAATPGSAAIVRERNSSVTLNARMRGRGLVVLNDSLMEGWSVRVDGRPAPALRVNSVMRGVIVPAGDHEVVWSYRVPGLCLGAAMSLSTLLALLGAVVLIRRRAS